MIQCNAGHYCLVQEGCCWFCRWENLQIHWTHSSQACRVISSGELIWLWPAAALRWYCKNNKRTIEMHKPNKTIWEMKGITHGCTSSHGKHTLWIIWVNCSFRRNWWCFHPYEVVSYLNTLPSELRTLTPITFLWVGVENHYFHNTRVLPWPIL